MRSECLNSRYSYDQALPVSRLVTNIGNSILIRENQIKMGFVRGYKNILYSIKYISDPLIRSASGRQFR